MPKKVIFMIIILVAIMLGTWFLVDREQAGRPGQDRPGQSTFDKSLHSLDQPGSIWWIVNKNRPLPADYVPGDLVTPNVPKRTAGGDESQVSQKIAQPLEKLIHDASATGHNLMLVSGYRSYDLQVSIYNRHVSQLGQTEADRVSARPGTSEHQTGLAADVGRPDRHCELEVCFGDTPEGQWVLANAHKYGFVIRYPKGKESVTSYQYEPWHLRYVGKDLAGELKRTELTMEEFFGL